MTAGGKGGLIFVLVLLGAGQPEALAQDAVLGEAAQAESQRDARELYEAGMRHYNLAEYDPAIDAFKAAYHLYEAPGFLFNIALAYRMKGDCVQAVHFYKTYLRLAPTASNRREVELRLASLARCAAEQVQSSQPTAPETRPTVPAPEPPPLAATVATEAPRPGRTKKIVGASLVGVGGVALGAAVYFGLRAYSASQEIDALFADTGTWSPLYADLEDDRDLSRNLSVAMSAVAVAAGTAGGVLYVHGVREERAHAAPFSILPRGDGVGVLWTGSF